jgi:hypothetical protein
MVEGSKPEDKLARACRLVGLFQYHFARIEQKIDQGVIKLLDLDDKAGPIVTGSVDFAKKLNFVRTAAYQQARNEKDRKFGKDTCDGAFAVNNVRQLVIHSSFEPTPDGDVQFKRTVAKDGRVRVDDQVWDDKQFKDQYTKMSKLTRDLDKLIGRIKPVPTVGPIHWVGLGDLVRIDPVGRTKPDMVIRKG